MARKKATTGVGTSAEDIERLLTGAGGEGGQSDGASGSDAPDGAGNDPLDTAEEVARMKACFARLGKEHNFKPGQLVQWKKGLKNKRTPEYGEPIIVTQFLDTTVFDTTCGDSSSPYFREPLTLIAGELTGNGDFLCFHYDARRFEPYQG